MFTFVYENYWVILRIEYLQMMQIMKNFNSKIFRTYTAGSLTTEIAFGQFHVSACLSFDAANNSRESSQHS